MIQLQQFVESQTCSLDDKQKIIQFSFRMAVLSLAFLASLFIAITCILSKRMKYWTFKLLFVQATAETIDLAGAIGLSYQSQCHEQLCIIVAYIMHSSWLTSLSSSFMIVYMYYHALKFTQRYNFLRDRMSHVIFTLFCWPYFWLITPTLRGSFGPTGWALYNSDQKFILYCGFKDSPWSFFIFWTIPLLTIIMSQLYFSCKASQELKVYEESGYQNEESLFMKNILIFPRIYCVFWTLNSLVKYVGLSFKLQDVNIYIYCIYVFIFLSFELHLVLILYCFCKYYEYIQSISQSYYQYQISMARRKQKQIQTVYCTYELFRYGQLTNNIMQLITHFIHILLMISELIQITQAQEVDSSCAWGDQEPQYKIQFIFRMIVLSIALLSSLLIGIACAFSNKINCWPFRLLLAQSVAECIDISGAIGVSLQSKCHPTLCRAVGYIMHCSWLTSFSCSLMMVFMYYQTMSFNYNMEKHKKRILKYIAIFYLAPYFWLLYPLLVGYLGPAGWKLYDEYDDDGMTNNMSLFCGFKITEASEAATIQLFESYTLFWTLPLLVIFGLGGFYTYKIHSSIVPFEVDVNISQSEELEFMKGIQTFPKIYGFAWLMNNIVRYLDAIESLSQFVTSHIVAYVFYAGFNILFELHMTIVLCYFYKHYNHVLDLKQIWLHALICRRYKPQENKQDVLLIEEINEEDGEYSD